MRWCCCGCLDTTGLLQLLVTARIVNTTALGNTGLRQYPEYLSIATDLIIGQIIRYNVSCCSHDDISQYRILKSKVYKIKTIPFWMESKEGLTKCFMVVRNQCLLFALSAVYGDDVLSCTVASCED